MRLRKYTKRKSATGKPYPQCQHVSDGKQCEKPVYADGKCYEHYQIAGSSRDERRLALGAALVTGRGKCNEHASTGR